MSNFERALAHILKSEGGFVSHSLDRGRETNFGITRATLGFYRKREVTAEDVVQLTPGEAAEIYYKMYWIPNGLDRITNPTIATAIFDQVVNRRASEVIRGIQLAVSRDVNGIELEPDGVLGPVTAQVLNGLRPERLLVMIAVEAQQAYCEIVTRAPAQQVFLKGWLARTWRLLMMV